MSHLLEILVAFFLSLLPLERLWRFLLCVLVGLLASLLITVPNERTETALRIALVVGAAIFGIIWEYRRK